MQDSQLMKHIEADLKHSKLKNRARPLNEDNDFVFKPIHTQLPDFPRPILDGRPSIQLNDHQEPQADVEGEGPFTMWFRERKLRLARQE